MFIFWMEVLAYFFGRQNPMGSCTIPMSKCEKQNVLFILEHKYAQSHKKKKKPLICSMKHGTQLPNAKHTHK